MSPRKVQCTECASNEKCSRRTKAFVNYCGSRPEMYAEQIKIAVRECLANQGFLFKRIKINHVSMRPV